MFRSTACLLWLLAIISVAAPPARADETPGAGEKSPDAVSYYHQVRPIFQAHCQGCHQPAKPNGSYDMTSHEKLIAAGDSEIPAVVAGDTEESFLLEMITPYDGEAEMPKGKPPLAAADIALVRRWIQQGAVDDTPDDAQVAYSRDHPPEYSRPPVITSLDFSPDGTLLAVAGFHEVLLHKADGSGLVDRLVGMSPRIESVRFSPDGKQLAVTGGRPARFGEVQIWNTQQRELSLSVQVGYDTLYGASWSPDGALLAFGCTDNTVRAIDAQTGQEVLYQGSHNDWVLDTVFTRDSAHLISVGQDRTAKLTEVATQRFVDNITSITPGALRGGIFSVARHPGQDAILVGGADGVPKLYHVHRQSKRVIGDDANLIRRFPALTGRVYGVAINHDGSRMAAVSSLDGRGYVKVFSSRFEATLPADIEKIVMKTSSARSAEDKKKLNAYHTSDVTQIADVSLDTALYAIAFHPGGNTLAVAGADGQVRLLDSETCSPRATFLPVSVAAQQTASEAGPLEVVVVDQPLEDESLHPADKLSAIEVQPPSARIERRYDGVQFLVTGVLTSGARVDLTRIAKVRPSSDIVQVSPRGAVRGRRAGQTELTFTVGQLTATAHVDVGSLDAPLHVDFIHDVKPAIAKMGCNTGTCHGANNGKGSLKLSLRGNDAVFDVRAWADELASRRVNRASPQQSLMLLKSTAEVPHEGGQVTRPGEPYYEIMRRWIADGARLDLESPRVSGIEIFPKDPIVERIGGRQQFRVVATYTDGHQRDVTADVFLESGDTEVALADSQGLLTVARRGEAPILARYEGAYAATTLTVMGDRDGFAWVDPPMNNYIDELVASKQQRAKTLPSDVCTDAEFLRRVSLDLTGLPPTAEQVRSFLADDRHRRIKRDELIDRLIGSQAYVEHWTNKWADLLQVNRKFLGADGARAFRDWIRAQVAENRPYDEFAYSILTASGSNRENPPASYYKILRSPEETMENTTQLFLALRFNCNKCHDHPFERWTQDQYFETAAFFAQVGLKKDPVGGQRQIGATAVEAGKPLYEIIFDRDSGEVTHERSGAITPPEFPYPSRHQADADVSRRERLARWITSPDNRYFAKSFVNRMWGYLLGRGLIEPLDDIRAGNPPTNPELLDRMTDDFIAGGFDVRYLVRTICQSRTYQMSIETNRWNEDDTLNYSHAIARRLPAEVLYDALHGVTGATSRLPGVPPGTRAAELPDAGVKEPSGFLAKLGRPPRESACECERATGMQFGPVMALVTGPTVGEVISDPENDIARLVANEPDDRRLVGELFLRILSRPAKESEIAAGLAAIDQVTTDHQRLLAEMRGYEASIAPDVARQESQRQARIAAASEELTAYENQIAAREAELDRKQRERVAELEQALAEYESRLPDLLAAWEAREDRLTEWTPLDPVELSATSAVTLTRQDDLSVLATNSNGLGSYKVIAHTELTGITAVRLEALTDKRHPDRGPGRAGDGNFVLTEFHLMAAPQSAPRDVARIGLEHAQADFSQTGYDVSTAVDGLLAPQRNGWAIAPQQGKSHRACFNTAEPVGYEGGTVLTFLLHQQYKSGQHTLGRFRLSVTGTPGPVLLDGIPETIAALLDVPAEQREPAQQAALLDYYRGIDGPLREHTEAVAAARQPRPVDPQLKRLRDTLAEAERPLPVDPKLARMRQDAELSAAQADNPRLTAAQDIAWALINSSAFLFNH